jgi:hypothetical protein
VVGVVVAVVGAGCGGSDCERFYGELEDCGFGDVSDADLDECEAATVSDESCAGSFRLLAACVDNEGCGYPEACGVYLEAAASCF